jgi:hypothetical protein
MHNIQLHIQKRNSALSIRTFPIEIGEQQYKIYMLNVKYLPIRIHNIWVNFPVLLIFLS